MKFFWLNIQNSYKTWNVGCITAQAVSCWCVNVEVQGHAQTTLGFVVKIVVLGKVVSESCSLSMSLSLHQCSILTCASVTLAVSSWQIIESLSSTVKWSDIYSVSVGSFMHIFSLIIQGGAEPTDTFQMVIGNIWKQGKISKTFYKYVQVCYLFPTDYKRIFWKLHQADGLRLHQCVVASVSGSCRTRASVGPHQ